MVCKRFHFDEGRMFDLLTFEYYNQRLFLHFISICNFISRTKNTEIQFTKKITKVLKKKFLSYSQINFVQKDFLERLCEMKSMTIIEINRQNTC